MKITCAKRDDLMRARYDYDTLTEQYQKRVDDSSRAFRQVEKEAKDAIVNEIFDQIGATSLDLRVRADWDWLNFNEDTTSWQIDVQANEHRNFDENIALGWNWSAKLDRQGNVVKDSGSWSGLKAVTPEQIADLEESVRVIKILNNIDWSSILRKDVPKYSQFIDEEAENALRERKKNRPDFDTQIFESELEDAIANGEWIKMEGRPETEYRHGTRRGEFWVKILSMTNKFVNCTITYRNFQGEVLPPNEGDVERISKAKLFANIVKPLETKKLF